MNGTRVENLKTDPGLFRAKELWGSFFDLWFLIPVVGLMVASEQGGSTSLMGRNLLVMGGAWALSALLFRTPLPLQPLKVWAFLFLILHPTPEVVSLSAVLLGLLLFLSGHAGLAERLEARLADHSIERIRTAVTLYVRGVATLAIGLALFRHFPGLLPPEIAALFPGASPSTLLSILLLVLPQLPVTLVNGILATVRERRKNGELSPSSRTLLTGTRLLRWLGLVDFVAGVAGALPFCHGAGNLWVYRRHSVRSLLSPLASSATLLLLGTLLLRGSLPLSSPLVYGSFLAGFLLAEHLLKGKEKGGLSLRLWNRSETSPFELWAMAGGAVSGVLLLGGLPLLLGLFLGMNAAISLSSCPLPERFITENIRGAGGGVDRPALSRHNLPNRHGNASPLLHLEGSPAPLSSENEPSQTLFLTREAPVVPSPPEHFFRRAREIPEEIVALILLLLFPLALAPSYATAFDSDPLCRQKKIHSLLSPLRAP